MDVAQAARAEKELEAMIVRRSRKGDVDPDEQEELWKESVRRYNARRREEDRQPLAVLPREAGGLPPPHPGGVDQLPPNAGRETTSGRISMNERLTDVAVRPTAEHYALPTPQEVEDEITGQRSIGVTAHLQSGVS